MSFAWPECPQDLEGISMVECPLCAKWRLGVATVLAVLAFISSTVSRAQDSGTLSIELNKVENTEQGCLSVFLLDNETGHELHRFRLDLVVFDQKGVYAKQLLVDMAPLYEDKKTMASFLLGEAPCDDISSVLINDVPQCENGAGASLDCVKFLQVQSRSDIELEK
jgi:hypothetical protein